MTPNDDWVADAVRDLPGLLTPADAAKFLGVCQRTLARWSRQGRLKTVRLTPGGSGRVRVPRAEVARLLRGATP